MQISRTQIKSLPHGFTPTSEGISRKFRRSPKYQEFLKKWIEENSKIEEGDEQVVLHNFITNEQGELIHNPLLTNESTINTTTE